MHGLYTAFVAELCMPLSNKGTDAWRPVQVTPLTGALYRVEGPMPADEKWQYPPGSLISIHWKRFPDGARRLVPTGLATTRAAFVDYYGRTAGLALGALPYVVALNSLVPRTTEGRPEPVPFLISSAVLMVGFATALIGLRPKSMIGRWAAWLGFGIGALFCLLAVPDLL